MKTNLKNGILFICLNEEFGREVTKTLAEVLSLHFADCKELIEYDLFSSGDVLKQCGVDYYLKREKKVIKMVCGYEDTLMFAGFDIFNHNDEIFSKYSTKVYLKLPKKLLSSEEILNKIAYEDRDKDLENRCDITITLKNLNKKTAIKEICKVLGALKWIS